MVQAKTLLCDLGQVALMQLPDDWLEGASQKRRLVDSLFRQFNPPDNKDVALCHYYRGRGMTDKASEEFYALLQKSPHNLTLAEIQAAGELLRGRESPEDFGLISARTEDFNGKRVLIVEGRYKRNDEDTYAIFVDAEKEQPGKFVQELFFQAPKNEYLKYAATARNSLESIEWK